MAKRKAMRNPNGYGSVHKIGGNRRKPWRVRVTKGWDENNKQVFANLGYFETRPEAMIVLAKYNENPWDTNTDTLTFAKLYDFWMKSEANTRSEANTKYYDLAFRKCEVLHNALIKQLKAMHLQDIIDNMEGGHTTKKRVKTIMNKMYTYAMKNDLAEKDYAAFVKVPKDAEPLNPKNPFKDDEIVELWNRKNDIQIHIAKILMFSGMRIGELLELESKNIFLDKGYMIGGIKTDAGKNRVIPISKYAKPSIEVLLDINEKMFIFDASITYYICYMYWNEHITGHTPHDTRHTFTSLMNRAEINDVSIERIVGHKSQGITKDVYTHKSTDDLLRAMNQFDTFIEKTLCI